jgi:predicted secreted hydrolase
MAALGKKSIAFAALLAAALALALFWIGRDRSPEPRAAPLSAIEILGARGNTAGYARADKPREFQFPADHGPHHEFQTEWWYWTGVLDGPSGRRFGYQLTFFRSALSPHAAPRTSAWAATNVYMAHFTVTDEKAQTFRAHERTAREAVDLAGASAAPFRVWVLDWEARGPDGATAMPVHLRAAEGDLAIDLLLDEGKPPVLEGDHGLSQKGPEPGDASYYYSLTRMPTHGVLTSGGARYEVSGESWMDREFSTGALGRDLVGWDWLALALSDGRELMFYRLRRADGSIDPLSAGSLIDAAGQARHLAAADLTMTTLSQWQSARSGATYPASFRLSVPGANIDLDVKPMLLDQELDVSFRYWEGAVSAEGRSDSAVPRARGYVERTGYDRPSPSR